MIVRVRGETLVGELKEAPTQTASFAGPDGVSDGIGTMFTYTDKYHALTLTKVYRINEMAVPERSQLGAIRILNYPSLLSLMPTLNIGTAHEVEIPVNQILWSAYLMEEEFNAFTKSVSPADRCESPLPVSLLQNLGDLERKKS